MLVPSRPFSRSALAIASALAGMLAAGTALAEPVKLTILHINDVDRMEDKRGVGGLARVMGVVKQEEANADHVLFTHGGDAISPSLMSGFDKGAHMIDLLNASGVDLFTLGNHEFDFGPEVAKERIAEAKFPIVATNVIDADGKIIAGALPTWTTEVGPYTIGFYGLTTPDTAALASPGPVTFAPLVDTAKATAKALREQGADLVVALAHTSIGEDMELVRAGTGTDIFMSGHDHVVMNYFDGKTAVVEAASQGDYVGVLEITMDTVKSGDRERFVWSPSFRTVSTATVEPDAEMAAKVQGYLDQLSKELDVAVGKTESELDSRRSSVRGGETAIGNLIADAMREEVGADVGFTNGGGIRGDKVYEAGTTLTRRDIQTELPFGNKTVKLEMTGQQLLAALENGVSQVEEGAGRFPQVSNLTFTYDPKAEPGARVKEAMVGGKPLDPNATYTVATNDYMAGGGDGYTVFRDAKVLIDPNAATFMATTVMDHIAAQGTVAPKVEGRIKTVQ